MIRSGSERRSGCGYSAAPAKIFHRRSCVNRPGELFGRYSHQDIILFLLSPFSSSCLLRALLYVVGRRYSMRTGQVSGIRIFFG